MLKNLFFNFEDYKLERFQVENLSTSVVPFTFYSLDPLPDESQLIINFIKYIKEPLLELEQEAVNKESPIVFVCKNSRKSKKIIKKAVGLGFKNVYFVDDGFKSIKK